MKLTFEQIGIFLAFLVSFISSVEFLSKKFKKQVDKTLNPLNESIKQLDISQCKNFLVKFLGDLEKGIYIDKIEMERAHEIYDHYTNDLNQNSYIHKRWKNLIGGDEHEK